MRSDCAPPRRDSSAICYTACLPVTNDMCESGACREQAIGRIEQVTCVVRAARELRAVRSSAVELLYCLGWSSGKSGAAIVSRKTPVSVHSITPQGDAGRWAPPAAWGPPLPLPSCCPSQVAVTRDSAMGSILKRGLKGPL